MSEFTHFDAAGNALMVDVSDKADTERVAVAQGKICVSREIYEKIAAGSVAKGDVLGVARVAGIMAAKRTSELIRLADSRQVDLIITTGGTGLSLCDVTPEATMAVATRNVPGIAEAIRAESLKITRRAMLSRGVSVVRGQTLIVNLPGSTKAVEEALAIVMPQMEHGLRILKGSAHDCARK